jgi:acylphosphatase
MAGDGANVENRTGRFYLISGRVQGVGYRAFAAEGARRAGVAGWARNLDDGRVEVHAVGTAGQLDEFEAWLRRGPRVAEVHRVEMTEAAASDVREFLIRS